MVRVVREWLGIDAHRRDREGHHRLHALHAGARGRRSTPRPRSSSTRCVQNSTGTVGELLSANWSIVDSTLAPIYGVTSAGANAHTMLPKRLGILNQAAFLSVFAHAQESGARASRRRGHAPGRVHEAARSGVAEHRRSCRPRPTRRSRRASASRSTRPTPRAPPATTPSTRSASRSSCSTAWGRSARRERRGHVQGRAPGTNGS